MTYTRVNSVALLAALSTARRLLEQARQTVEPYLVTSLTDEGRKAVLRCPDAAADATRKLAEVAVLSPQLAVAAEYDRDAVLEDVINAEALAGFAERCAELERWFEDSKLVWEGEYYSKSLELHRLAKARAVSDGSLEPLVTPFSVLFANRRKPAKKDAPEATSKKSEAEDTPKEGEAEGA